MNVVINSEILQAYSLCSRKAYLLMFAKEKGTLHEYEKIFIKNKLQNETLNIDILKRKYIDIYPYNSLNFEKGFKFLTNANLTIDNLQAYCSILTRVDNLSYEPTIFIGTHSIRKVDKINLIFVGYLLKKIHGIYPNIGHIINMKGESRRLKIKEGYKVIMPLLEPIREWLNESSSHEPYIVFK